jgi:hypothetical protein
MPVKKIDKDVDVVNFKALLRRELRNTAKYLNQEVHSHHLGQNLYQVRVERSD